MLSDRWSMMNAPGWFVEKWLAMNNRTLMGSSLQELVEIEVEWRALWGWRRAKHISEGYPKVSDGEAMERRIVDGLKKYRDDYGGSPDGLCI